MRYLPFFILLYITPQFADAAELLQVPPIATHGEQSRTWYLEQARLWQAEIQKEPANPTAWRNYYLATEYGKRNTGISDTERQDILDAILDQMEPHITDSYEYAYLLQRRAKDPESKLKHMEKAYARCATCGEIIENLAYAYETTGQDERAADLWAKLYQTQRIAPGLLDYNYNMLQSTMSDAILFTNGDNDTFPALVLQRALEVRDDVLILNLWGIQHQRSTLAQALKKRNIDIPIADLPDESADFVAELAQRLTDAAPDVALYFALSVSNTYKERINDRLYIEGLASRFSPSGVDNMARLQNNLEHRFRIDSLEHNWYDPFHPSTVPVVNRLNTNYTFPFILLAEHYQRSGEETRANRWRERAMHIARPYPYLMEELQNRAIND